MNNKKAFEIQFNWIFILVAGAAIIVFFASVITKNKNVSEISTNAIVLKSVESIITGASISTDTISTIEIPNSNIEVRCNRVSSGGASKQFSNLVLFAPGLIKGNKLITQTLPFNAPYRATNILYMTSPSLRYIIIGDSDTAREINKSLPLELKKEFYDVPLIKNSNNYKVRFIVFNDDMIDFPQALKNMPDFDVTAVKVKGDISKGTIDFYQKNAQSWELIATSAYLGKPSLIGAVYSDSAEAYECNMKNIFSRLNLITKIYSQRTTALIAKYERCKDFYNDALNHLGKISTASLEFKKENLDIMAESLKSLSDENINMQVYSCALIY